MITLENEDEELMKKIKEETRKDERHPEIEKEDGFKRFNGLILVPKSMETPLIERYHDDVREGIQELQGRCREASKELLLPWNV